MTGEPLEEHLIPYLGLDIDNPGNIYFVVPESKKTLKVNGVVSKGRRMQHEKTHCGPIRGNSRTKSEKKKKMKAIDLKMTNMFLSVFMTDIKKRVDKI